MSRRYDSRTTIFSPEGRLFQVEYAMKSIENAGTVIGILAPWTTGQASMPAELDTGKEPVGAPSRQTAPSTSTGGEGSKEGGAEMELDPTTPAKPSTSAEPTTTSAGTTSKPKETTSSTSSEDKLKSTSTRAGIVLAAEKKVTSKLLEKERGGSVEKIFLINSNIISGVAGLTSDANSLVNYCRNSAQVHLTSYDEAIPVEQLARGVCDMKQGYTQFGGLRPFGVSFLFAGHDPHYEFQLYASDPSGNYSGYKAAVIGANSKTAEDLLKQDYKEDIGLEEAMELAVKVLSKTLDATTLDSEKIEFATLTVDPETGLPHAHIFKPHEIDALLRHHGLAKKEEGEEQAGADSDVARRLGTGSTSASISAGGDIEMRG